LQYNQIEKMSGGEDFCEYVYNPLMRQYQAMMRLLQIMRDSTSSDCNDIECFSNDQNPLTNNPSSASALSSYLPMLFIWAMFVFALFMFRPSSMRKKNKDSNEKSPSSNSSTNRFSRNFRDDDDNSTVS
jgi:hypothetical protein